MGLSKEAKRAKHRNFKRRELAGVRVLCDEQAAQLVELRKLVRYQRGELAAIEALCVKAGMVEPSTTLLYLRGVFYKLHQMIKACQAVDAVDPVAANQAEPSTREKGC